MAQKFSNKLGDWLKSDSKKTIAQLEEVFEQKSFAVTFLVLMAVPALPIPTGGITHIFEIIVMLLALEMAAGRKTIWLPQKYQHRELPKTIRGSILPFLKKRIKWLEKRSKPRMNAVVNNGLFIRFNGVVVFGLALTAFVAPPFSGLDTLPSMGVVVISLGLILNDIAFVAAGTLVGLFGIFVDVFLSASLFTSIQHLLKRF